MKTLTNYDRYVLARQNNNGAAVRENTQANSIRSNEYDEYLLDRLRSTTPSETRLMSESEFYAARRGETAPAPAEPTAAVATPKEPKFRLKKRGKIFLTVYVILMLALASILIVTNTTRSVSLEGISFNKSAGAASSSGSVSETGVVRPMTVEEEETEETNWFDKLCDSLNK